MTNPQIIAKQTLENLSDESKAELYGMLRRAYLVKEAKRLAWDDDIELTDEQADDIVTAYMQDGCDEIDFDSMREYIEELAAEAEDDETENS